MTQSVILGLGRYVPDKIVRNEDLDALLGTSGDWIERRTGIKERRFVDLEHNPMGSLILSEFAAKEALANAGVTNHEIDCMIYATSTPQYIYPGNGVLLQAKLDIPSGVPSFDIRNQCAGFLYGLFMADAFIRLGLYQRILLVGAENHSNFMQFTEQYREIACLFADAAGAVVVGPSNDTHRGVMDVTVHGDGRHAEDIYCPAPQIAPMPYIEEDKLRPGGWTPVMEGKAVFRHATRRMPEVVQEILTKHGLTIEDVNIFIAHQANLRILDLVQRRLCLTDEQVFNNIQHYGNTTSASIPIAMYEALALGRLKSGDLLCLAAFGSGYTWGAALIRW